MYQISSLFVSVIGFIKFVFLVFIIIIISQPEALV
jgi:hypothetical protein